MATFVAIPEKTQTATAMHRVLDYVMQAKKTDLDGIALVSGQHCVPECAYEEFMATKHRFGKASGVFFKQYVQSFKPDCGATPQQIHAIGVELAKEFDGFEVVVATHIDRDHWHNHFVVNAVNCETGRKIQIGEKELERLRDRSDAICQQHGLEILPPYEKPSKCTINQREYRAALRGDSKKLRLINAIEYAVATSRSKERFIEQMKKLGYGVKWIDHYKYITYTTPDGTRFRDTRLFDDKYLKKNMEGVFAYGYETTTPSEPDRTDHSGYGRGTDQTSANAVSGTDTRTVQSVGTAHLRDWASHCHQYGFDIESAYAGIDTNGCAGYDRECDQGGTQRQRYEAGGGKDGHTDRFNGTDEAAQRAVADGTAIDDVESESTGSGIVEAEAPLDVDWSGAVIGGIRLAADLAMIGGREKDDTKPKPIRERKRGQKKRQNQDQGSADHHDGGIGLNM